MSAYFVHFRYQNDEYRFPVATQVINGKMMKELVLKFQLFPIPEHSNIWVESNTDDQSESHFLSEAHTIVFRPDSNYIDILTEKWVPHYDSELNQTIAALNVITVENPLFTFT